MPETSDDYLIWSNEHRKWWKAGARGYTTGLLGAGRYSREAALQICRDAIPSSSHVGAVAEIPVRLADVAEFTRGAMVPACMMREGD